MLIIFGSTGNVAKAVLTSLRTSNTVDNNIATQLRIITRDENCSAEMLGLVGAEVIRGNITDSKGDLVSYLSGGRKVFCVLPQRLSSLEMVEVSQRFAEACIEASVTHVVRIGSFGIDGTVLQGSLGSAHVTAEAYMHSLGLIVTSIRPTSFFSNFIAYDLPSLRATGSFASPLGKGSMARVNWISCDDIGTVAAIAMQNEEWDGRVLEITGGAENTLSAEGTATHPIVNVTHSQHHCFML